MHAQQRERAAVEGGGENIFGGELTTDNWKPSKGLEALAQATNGGSVPVYAGWQGLGDSSYNADSAYGLHGERKKTVSASTRAYQMQKQEWAPFAD